LKTISIPRMTLTSALASGWPLALSVIVPVMSEFSLGFGVMALLSIGADAMARPMIPARCQRVRGNANLI
jgi:hypothetical protein